MSAPNTPVLVENVNTALQNTNELINAYSVVYENANNEEELLNLYKKENALLEKTIKTKSTESITNDRKTYYQDIEIQRLNTFYSYMFWGFYAVIVICYAIFAFIYPSPYSHKTRVLVFAILFLILIFPGIATWILGKTINIVMWLLNLLPKNVYLQP